MGLRRHSPGRVAAAAAAYAGAALAVTAAVYVGRERAVTSALGLPDPPAARASMTPGPLPSPVLPPPGWDLANVDHERVDYWVQRLRTDRRPILERALELRGRYGSLVSEALAQRGMPQDLQYLAMIESGFNPRAYSRAHASGLWQFIPETGGRYGLEVNRAVDERRDPVESTDAALRYLGRLYKRFGSWYLAAAAYNTGENRVGRIMREEKGRERGTDTDFYDIYHRLPGQTRDYVPVMIAAARIGKDPAAYGFKVDPHEPWTYG